MKPVLALVAAVTALLAVVYTVAFAAPAVTATVTEGQMIEHAIYARAVDPQQGGKVVFMRWEPTDGLAKRWRTKEACERARAEQRHVDSLNDLRLYLSAVMGRPDVAASVTSECHIDGTQNEPGGRPA